LANAKISPHKLSRRGGRADDRAGLEIRIQDFGLNWTDFAPSVPVFDEFTFLIRVNWTGVVATALNFFERVTFLGYVTSNVRVRVYFADLRSSHFARAHIGEIRSEPEI
jgi:hypothetical protein